jgi:hypothetical protein
MHGWMIFAQEWEVLIINKESDIPTHTLPSLLWFIFVTLFVMLNTQTAHPDRKRREELCQQTKNKKTFTPLLF